MREEIKIDELRPGMVLACTVYAPTGEVLLKSGAMVKRSYLIGLRNYGVSNVRVFIREYDFEEYDSNVRPAAS